MERKLIIFGEPKEEYGEDPIKTTYYDKDLDLWIYDGGFYDSKTGMKLPSTRPTSPVYGPHNTNPSFAFSYGVGVGRMTALTATGIYNMVTSPIDTVTSVATAGYLLEHQIRINGLGPVIEEAVHSIDASYNRNPGLFLGQASVVVADVIFGGPAITKAIRGITKLGRASIGGLGRRLGKIKLGSRPGFAAFGKTTSQTTSQKYITLYRGESAGKVLTADMQTKGILASKWRKSIGGNKPAPDWFLDLRKKNLPKNLETFVKQNPKIAKDLIKSIISKEETIFIPSSVKEMVGIRYATRVGTRSGILFELKVPRKLVLNPYDKYWWKHYSTLNKHPFPIDFERMLIDYIPPKWIKNVRAVGPDDFSWSGLFQ